MGCDHPPDDRPPDQSAQPADEATSPSTEGLEVQQGRVSRYRTSLESTVDRQRRRPLVDLAFRVGEHDRANASSVVGSAIAFRLFLFFIPLVLFVVGVVGFLADHIGPDDVANARITGEMARQISAALDERSSGRWIAVLLGLIGMVTTGRTLSKVLVQASCLSWRLPVTSKAPIRLTGAVIGLVVGMGLIAVVINLVRAHLGIGAAGVSFALALALYTLAWLLLSAGLPRATTDPGALLPGALLVGGTLVGLQAISQLYLPSKFERASQLYGALGATIVVLGWFFILGRVMVLSMVLNAVVFERFGSISQVVFGLPVLRAVPRRWPRMREYFELDEEGSE